MTKEQMECVVQENMQKIYLYCVKRLGNTTIAEDVASDIILELLRSYQRIRDDGAVYGFLWSVANNFCRNYWRKSQKADCQELPENFTGACGVTPEEACIKDEEKMLLRRELSLLREKYRRIMISYYIGGKSCEAIAEEMHLSVTNVKQCLFEGRKKVKEGMEMVREYGELSYAPEKFTMNFWGNSSKGYWELFERKLPGNIIIAAYETPKTLEEISTEVGVGVPYLEDEVEILQKMGLLTKKGKTYQSNMVLYNDEWKNKVNAKTVELLKDKLSEVKTLVDAGVTYLEDTDYRYAKADTNTKKWFVLIMLVWEAINLSEKKMKTSLEFPLLENGSVGYVMGIRGEYHYDTNGINGHYNVNGGYMRVMNFKALTDKILNPFEYRGGVGKLLGAAVAREEEPEEMEALSSLLEEGFVSVKDGRLQPEFAVISEKDYYKLAEKLGAGIDAMAELVAKQRDMAGEELRRMTPNNIPRADEVGALVAMWGVLEGMVSLVLEDGFMTKGEGQNLTTFFFKQ